jgi:hypothetical protein
MSQAPLQGHFSACGRETRLYPTPSLTPSGSSSEATFFTPKAQNDPQNTASPHVKYPSHITYLSNTISETTALQNIQYTLQAQALALSELTARFDHFLKTEQQRWDQLSSVLAGLKDQTVGGKEVIAVTKRLVEEWNAQVSCNKVMSNGQKGGPENGTKGIDMGRTVSDMSMFSDFSQMGGSSWVDKGKGPMLSGQDSAMEIDLREEEHIQLPSHDVGAVPG